MNINLAMFGLCTTLRPSLVRSSESFWYQLVTGAGTASIGTWNVKNAELLDLISALAENFLLQSNVEKIFVYTFVSSFVAPAAAGFVPVKDLLV